MAAGSQEDNQYSLAAFFTYLREIPKKDDNQSGTKYRIRDGAEKDKQNFEEMFWSILGFEPFTGNKGDSSVENLTLDMWKDWESKIKATNFSKCKYVVLGFSSHGCEETADGIHQPVILLSDGKTLPLSDILKVLTVESNSTLEDKPRIVFLFACRAITKEADRFKVRMPQDSVSNVLPVGSWKPQLVGLSDTFVKYVVENRADVLEYDIRWTKQEFNSVWTSLVIPKDSNNDKSTLLKIDKLDKDTSYCIIVREKTTRGFGPFSVPDYVRTLDAEDEGAELYVQGGRQDQQSSATGSDVGDPASPLAPRKKKFEVTPVSSEKEDKHYSAGNIPNNFLVVYGANRGRMNKRNKETGSWALDDLLKVLIKEEKDEVNIFHLLTKAAFEMSQRNSKNTDDESLNNKKGILCFSHTLTEDIMLKKREKPDPDLPKNKR